MKKPDPRQKRLGCERCSGATRPGLSRHERGVWLVARAVVTEIDVSPSGSVAEPISFGPQVPATSSHENWLGAVLEMRWEHRNRVDCPALLVCASGAGLDGS
jgi:hypothetical protein